MDGSGGRAGRMAAAKTSRSREEKWAVRATLHARIGRSQCLRLSSGGRGNPGNRASASTGLSPEHGHTPHAGFQGVCALGLHYNLKPCYHFEFTAPGFIARQPKSQLEIA